jgi:glycosyltransferase involved in cell wall biosynthesis
MGKTMVVIPVHNEAPTIASVVLAARVYLPVIVVDDASEDGSGQHAVAAGAIVLTLSTHCGKGAALRRGFAEALRRGATTVVTLDGDGQHDPRDIPRLLAASRRWPESVIIGGRLDSTEAIPLPRFYAMQVASFWINWLGQCQVQDTQSGFRLYPATLLRTLPLRHGGFMFESEVLIKAGQAGWRMREIPIRAVYPPGRTSQYRPLRDGIPLTAYLLYRGVRFWPAQCRLVCPWWWRMGDKTARYYVWRRTCVAALATLLLPLLGLCALAYLCIGHVGRTLLAAAIRWFYDPRLFAHPAAITRVLHDRYRLKRWKLV